MPNLLETLFQQSAIAPADCLLAAAEASLFVTRQPPADLPDAASCKKYLWQHLESRAYRIRPARADNLPALMALEEQCWGEPLRMPQSLIEQRILRYPQGQLVLLVGEVVVGVIYSQRIGAIEALDGVSATQIDALHDPDGAVAQLLAVNILPQMQQQNLGDQLLEFALIYCSLQPAVHAVAAITLCKHFDRAAGLSMADYICRRNEHAALADPILRFHELHGATIERPMPGYRPLDTKNDGYGVLVSYDIRHRSRKNLQIPAQIGSAAAPVTSKISSYSRAEIHAYVQQTMRECLSSSGQAVFSAERPLMEMGLDSADLLLLNEKMSHHYGVALNPAFFFQYNTADKIAAYFCDANIDLKSPLPGQPKANTAPKQMPPLAGDRQIRPEDIAIIGMACRLPGGIDTPNAFWNLLREGASLVGDLPAGRWQWPTEIDPASKHKGIDRGAFLDDAASFDAPFFRISPAEAESMDPQQRLMLELSWQAIEHAGYAPQSLAGSDTGVFIGASGSDYARLLDHIDAPVDAHYGTGSSMAVLANRISYFYDFVGPSLLLDTACSSSLVAVHEAIQSIRSGEASQALVGGVNLIFHPANSIAYYKAGMLAKDGLCKTFDQSANGYVRSEGAVMLLLKPLAIALTDGDRVHAVIKGSACNHGGQASGLTVPNPAQQARLLQTAWRSAEIDPRSLGYIEAHGTGTSLGDPIEVQGLKQAFEPVFMRDANAAFEIACGLGSVKTNIGHLEAAAGITGLLKTVLCLQQRQLPASLHFHRLNQHIRLSDTHLYIVDCFQEWTLPANGGLRTAGVSSFGSGGTNAHVVLTEYMADPAQENRAGRIDSGTPEIFVLSAKTRAQLLAYTRKYIAWLNSDESLPVTLHDLARQLQSGRQVMAERLALVVADRSALLEGLNGFCASQPQDNPETAGIQMLRSGTSAVSAPLQALTEGEAGRTFIRSMISHGEWEKIALLWQSGVNVDWSLMYESHIEGLKRIAVPTYPFARHRYWLPQSGHADTVVSAPLASDMAPLMLAPLWRQVTFAVAVNSALSPAPHQNLLVIGASTEQALAIGAIHVGIHALQIDSAATPESIGDDLQRLETSGYRPNHILWIAPPASEAELIGQQAVGVLSLFKLIKALLASTSYYSDGALDWTIVTCGTQAVFEADAIAPAHAGVHGLAGTLAREYPRWTIRSLDLENGVKWDIATSMRLPADPNGEVLACRSGLWYKRFLSPIVDLPGSTPVYRQRGVYVVIGGAGGIGEAWTRHVMTHYAAQVIWIGRRTQDAALQARLTELAVLGPPPLYLSADACDRASLQAALTSIKQIYPAVHGVIHSAVGLFDHSLAEMSEQRFGDILSVKIDASINLAQVFGQEALDFILYFSSIVALEKNGGLSGYAAGGAFEDAFALHLSERLPCAVKVINWGHWEIGTGATISDAAKIRLHQSGRLPLQPAQAMSALQNMLGTPIRQMAVIRTARPDLLTAFDAAQSLTLYPETAASYVAGIPPMSEQLREQVAPLRALSLFGNTAMEAQLLPLFAGTLASLGILATDQNALPASQTRPGFYTRWLSASRQMLAEVQSIGLVSGSPTGLDQLWQNWEAAKQRDFAAPDLRAAVTLAEACLRALPSILSGTTRATDILFPAASMHMVEGVYRDNAVADYFNKILAKAVVSAIELRLQQAPGVQLRLLEIGAGTGGTTAMILPYLAPYLQHIAEYTYTDVSKAFLLHADERIVPHYPFVVPKLFDVEKPLAGQDIRADHYDLVIATNVLHATRNIRRTLSNAKAALHKNGLLLLNEISTKSVFAHLTFGLLEGWWLSEDQPLRIPDAPGLYPQGWRQVLLQEGFGTVLFPAQSAHILGQQVIVAESDGVVRQSMPEQKTDQNREPVSEAESQNNRSDDAALKAAATTYLKKIAARPLRMDSRQIDALEPLETYGIDSILIVQITSALREVFTDVPSTLLFECQTIAALADYFIRDHLQTLRRVTGVAGGAATVHADNAVSAAAVSGTAPPDHFLLPRQPAASSNTTPLIDDDAIAVIGMSCRFPQAQNLEEYWQLLATGRDCVGEVPNGRWSMDGFFHADPDQAIEQGKSYSKWGGFLDRITDFDPQFFNISPKEAISIDPQERLFLQIAWETLEDAGYTRERLASDFGHQLGVFAGVTRTGFDLFGPQLWREGSTLYPHTSFSSVANRVSYFLNARGPSVPVDTMCSSSLTAIHQASQSLRSGECRLAIAGGVNLYLHPSGYVGLSASRMLSKDGVCRSFGKDGNGFVPGEGVGAVLLKPLAQAIADKDRIHAIIRATHINHGGKTNGYTVPNPQAQAELVRDTLKKAGVNARAVSYIEAHGTGTELGDPIEISGLTQAFRDDTQDTGFCALGSAKSNIGHLEAAAGIAGFIKVILQMQHGRLAPTLHASEPNPNIDFAKTPFVLQQALAEWPRPLLQRGGGQAGKQECPRIAGVSSFGAGGANAHVIVEEYRQPARPNPGPEQDNVIVLSARNEERLRAYAQRLHDFVDQIIVDALPMPAQLLGDLAYTLQTGREQMDVRLALVARSLPQLQEKLRRWLDGPHSGAQAQGMLEEDGIYQNQVKHHKKLIDVFTGDEAMRQTLETWFRQGQHARLLTLWSKGVKIDWERMYPVKHPYHRIGAPTYPFAATPYWLPLLEEKIVSAPMTNSTPMLPKTALQVESILTPLHYVAEKYSSPIGKPSAIALRATASAPTVFRTHAAIVQHPLRALLRQAPDTEIQTAIHLYDEGGGIFVIRVDPSAADVTAASACAGLMDCLSVLSELAHTNAPKALLLTGLDRLFVVSVIEQALPGLADAVKAVAACAWPVIAVLTGANSVAVMAIASVCDLSIGSVQGTYSDSISGTMPDGEAHARSGSAWPMVDQAIIDDYAREIAGRIGQASSIALTALKQHLAATPGKTPEQSQTLKHAVPWATLLSAPGRAETPVSVPFMSDVVTLQKYADGVLLMTLNDRDSKNTFSPAFVEGVIAAFEHIESMPEYKAVVMTGYDNYFACGGTRQGLLAIQSGSARFTDEQSYRMPLSCSIPVIAAMQGHAIGAGWTMGLFCDWTIYSEESVYQSPYMLYGFTPGAGSTMIFPQRLGRGLSNEILLTAREFQGRELKQRGIAMPVLPRSRVLAYALALAGELALSERTQLVQQKNLRSDALRRLLPDVFARELAMHDKTFVNNPEVIANIDRHFNQAAQDYTPLPGAIAVSNGNVAHPGTQGSDVPLQELLTALRQSLGEELQLQCEQIDGDTAFIDMGLDSIVAVTWVRKINRQFDLSIGATKVYNYPDLTRFAGFVLSLMAARRPNETVAVQTAMPAQDHSEQLLGWLRETLARELLLKPEDLDDDIRFIDLGLDSITAVTWIRMINKRHGLSVGATKVYSYPTLANFHAYLLSLLTGPDTHKQGIALASGHSDLPHAEAVLTAQKPVSEPSLIRSFTLCAQHNNAVTTPVHSFAQPQRVGNFNAEVNANNSAIAIIGMAGQFPKADNVKQFWRNLVDGRDCVSEVPAARWSLDAYYDADRNAAGKTVCRSMGLLEDVDVFDPLFFNISPSDAEYMDPQQRLFLENSWRCIEDAGYNPSDLSGSLCGVFVGCAVSDYAQLMKDPSQTHSAQGLMGESVAMLPARIAYFLNLQGPCLTIDTACSSSLVALASACDSLLLGHSEVALAGGVYVINGPDIHVKMSKAGMLSPDGRCYSFDQRANGFVPGEGVGVLMLKRLEQAERDGDDIYGVIRGWGVNQDGKSNGITAPNAQSQTRLETSVYRKFGIDPEHIGLIEAHGTGTKLGDPLEVEALCDSFRQFTERKNFCALGSAKSNIGHLATAAGVTGVIKALLALQHKTLPPTINYQALNEHIDLQDSPFFINTDCLPWQAEAGQKRLVAVSSFGFSGTNAHMVLEEAPHQNAVAAGAAISGHDAQIVLPLSAKSRRQLLVYAQTVCDFLVADARGNVGLRDFAYTFQRGRTAMPHRLAVVANTFEELRRRLTNFVANGGSDANCVSGEVLKKPVIGEAAMTAVTTVNTTASALALRWTEGESVDWALLQRSHATPARRRHGLPTYPFAREHYWTPEMEGVGTGIGADLELAIRNPTLAALEKTESKDGNKRAAADASRWHRNELPAAIDWQAGLRRYQQGQLVVIHADENQRHAFDQLLTQLRQAADLENSDWGPKPVYCDLRLMTTNVFPPQADLLIFLGGPKDDAAVHTNAMLSACLKLLAARQFGTFAKILFFMQADAGAGDNLAAEIQNATDRRADASPNQCRHALITYDDRLPLLAAMQRLCRECLSPERTSAFQPIPERIHYSNGHRLTMIPVAVHSSPQMPPSQQAMPQAIHRIVRQWHAREAVQLAQPVERREVLMLVNHESLHLARKLLEPGDFKNIVLVADASVQSSQIRNAINFSDAKSSRISAQILIDHHDTITHIIDLSDLYETARDYDADNPGKTVFYQTLIGAANDIAILYCTKGLQNFQSPQMSLAGAKFAGLVKMLSADYRHVDARFIDIDQAAYDQPKQLRDILLQEFGALLQETELCYRNGLRYAPVLSAVEEVPETAQNEALPIAIDGVYVISGGTNGVGLEIAKYLAGRGCRKLVLMGLTPLPPRKNWLHALEDEDARLSPYVKNKLRELIALERKVPDLQIYTGSLNAPQGLQRYFKKIRAQHGPVKGVIHCAGVYSDPDTPGFAGKDLERMQQVWEPKIKGLESLHALFKSDPLDFFVSLSSMTGLAPHLARGAADYATANAFVDFFSAYQHRMHNNTRYKSIVWSDWNQTGAITRVSVDKAVAVKRTFNDLGIRTFDNREGHTLFERAMAATAVNGAGGSDSRIIIGYLDLQRLEQVRPRLLYGRLVDDNASDDRDSMQQPSPVIFDMPEKSMPDASFIHHLDRWEAEKRAGLDVPVHKITEVIELDQIRHLEPDLIHRIHKLLFSGLVQQTQQVPQAAALKVTPENIQEPPVDLAQMITKTLMEVLKLKSIDPAQPFQDYGLDSISAMVLATRLEKRLKYPVQPRWLIDFCTIETLTGYLMMQGSRTS
ncbi:SDR family NAD(P)-dependent oxidoreductase [Glaciimonas sp. GNP009]